MSKTRKIMWVSLGHWFSYQILISFYFQVYPYSLLSSLLINKNDNYTYLSIYRHISLLVLFCGLWFSCIICSTVTFSDAPSLCSQERNQNKILFPCEGAYYTWRRLEKYWLKYHVNTKRVCHKYSSQNYIQ